MHQRLSKLKEIMNEEGLDGVLISSRSNTFYFTGFTGSTSQCLITKEKAYLVVDFRYYIQAKEQAFPGIEVVQYEQEAIETLHRLSLQYSVGKMGLEGDEVSYAWYGKLQGDLKAVQSFHDVQEKLNRIRVIKDSAELVKIQKAVDIADHVFHEILPYLKPGVKEYDIALEMEYKLKKLGAKGVSFDTIIASGPRSALPHGTAGMRELQKGDAVVMDFGAIYEGYCSDMTRTVFLGNPPSELIEVYEIVRRAQQEALQRASSGMKGKELDAVARLIINECGYEKCFGHSLGHGVGIKVHEMPTISPKGEELLFEGMVFTVEPGIYIEGLGGVRIEDMVYLTSDGVEILTKSTKECIIL